MATDLQTQIDALKTRVINLQYAIGLRAKRSEVMTFQSSVSTDLDSAIADLATEEAEIDALEIDLLDARDELRTHTH